MFANVNSNQEADDAAQARHTAVDVESGANISNAIQARPLTEVARALLWMVLRLLHRTDGLCRGFRGKSREGNDRCRSTLGSWEEKRH